MGAGGEGDDSACWAQTEFPSGCGAASPSQGRWDPDSLRPALRLGGQATAWECSTGRSLCLTKSSACGNQGSPLSQKGSLNLDLHVDLREGGRKLRLGPDPSPTWGHTWSFPRAPYCPCIWRILDYLLSVPKGKVQSSSRLESTFLLDFSLPALELKQKQKRLLLKAGRLRP